MARIEELYQEEDWKTEKHVPVIELPKEIEKGKEITVTVTVGKEITHPNETKHHIRCTCTSHPPTKRKLHFRC